MLSRTLVTPSAPRRLLVDECVPRPLVRALADLKPRTVQELGWTGVKNGKLLELAADQFDVLFTVDRDFAGAEDSVPHPIGVVILTAGSTDFERLLPHIDVVKAAAGAVSIGRVIRVRG